MKIIIIISFFLLASATAEAQDTLYLKNPSFEDNLPRPAALPEGWTNRGPVLETPPDIQPGSFNCMRLAQDGDTYVGLVVRDNNTWESIGQRLNGLLRKDSTYSFSLYACRSAEYMSMSRLTEMLTQYTAPAVLQVWGYRAGASEGELLAETQIISHKQWERYNFSLTPKENDYDELVLAAYYKRGPAFAYNGNVLIDNCSPIIQVKN